MKEQGAEEAVDRSGIFDEWKKVRETTEKRDPGGQEGKAEQFPKVEAEQAQKSMVSTVFWEYS